MNFEAIYQTYNDKVYRLCMGYVNDHEQARDLVQETFLIVWQQLPKFRNDSSVSTWIYRIASNNCLRQIEKEKRIPKGELKTDKADTIPSDIESKMQLLYKSISELEELDRIIISLELEDVRQNEIAQIMGLSESNVRVRIHRIKEKLLQKIKRYDQ